MSCILVAMTIFLPYTQGPHTKRPLSLCRGVPSGFLERDKSPIKRRVSKTPPKSTLGKLTVGTASTVR